MDTVNSRWDLYRDGLTQGAIVKFLACREHFYLRYVEGWVKKNPSEAIAFGSLFHNVLEATCKVPDKHAGLKSAINKYRRKMSKETGLTDAERVENTRMTTTVNLVANMYLDHYHAQDNERIWVAREETFRIPLLCNRFSEFPSTVEVPIRGRWDGIYTVEVPIRGRWDGIYDDGNGGLVLFETKTKGNIDEEGIQETLPFDIQTMLYVWAAERRFSKPVTSILYDVIRRPGQKFTKSDTEKTYQERIEKDIVDRPDHYYKRWRVTLYPGDVRRWASTQLCSFIHAIQTWFHTTNYGKDRINSPNHYLNPEALNTKYGRSDYFHLITKSQSFGLIQLPFEESFPELVD